MAEMGHPIIGDGKYGGSGQENLGDGWGASLGGEISRKLHLHARSISLDHPVTGKRLTITAPLPEHMARTWKTLGFDRARRARRPVRGRCWTEPMELSLVVFDIDGTLVDSAGADRRRLRRRPSAPSGARRRRRDEVLAHGRAVAATRPWRG